ncbi:MAG TPA: hypothetical protein VFX16_35745 [Pseudonocardiaceae bacterium]|nr:hypothetical protein [Pseudonocardiaceae bacterium]
MLLLVLLLVLAAFGLLVTALVSGATLWAWLSVGVSVVAAIVLVLDWSRRRAGSSLSTAATTPRAPAEPWPAPVVAATPDKPVDPEAEPAEEDTDAADLLVVTDLPDEVRVVDERPRYHLADCAWLAAKPTLGLPVGEARQLGFTPCAVCSPDRTLAAARRRAEAG